MMKNKVLVLSCVLALVGCLGAVSLAAEKEPVVGQSVGTAKFQAPITEEGATYLGLAKAEAFTSNDVKAPYLLVEQFSTTCPHCIAQAPIMNALFSKVEADPQMKAKVKFLGAGQGDDEMKMKMWKAFHKVPFALVPDPDNSFGKALNFTPYPVTVLLDKSGKILFAHIGTFESADEVFKQLQSIVK
jgi:hypothetical protein